MKLLLLHNRYQQAGGEDKVVGMEADMLRAAGHEVHLELVSNDSIAGFAGKVRTLLATPYDAQRIGWMHELLDRTAAELVHIHNFFPLLTPAVHEAAVGRGVPVVQTLHNYRLICAAGTLMRDGVVCEKCLSGRSAAILHRCYRGSVAGSAAVVAMQARAEREGTWERSVTRFIALTEFARSKFIEGGLPKDRLVVKPNFVRTPARAAAATRKGALFVGRLSAEKGAAVLMRAWQQVGGMPLSIIGEGPERAALEAMAPGNVRFLGQLSAERVAEEMGAAQMLLVPSLWYEGFPMTIVEAFAAGLPVVASDIGSLSEIVTEGELGRRFAPNDHVRLAAIVNELQVRPDLLARYGQSARAAYERLYTPERNLAMLEAIYRDAIGERRRAGVRPNAA